MSSDVYIGDPLKEPTLTIVIPIYNEAEALPVFLPELIAACEEHGWQVVLVNDGSKDRSREIIEPYREYPFVRIIHHKLNRGYGAALKTGIHHVNTTHVITMDSDGQHTVADVAPMFAFALANDTDLVIGKRGRWENASSYRELGKWLIKRFARLLMPLPVEDLNSGFKLYQTHLVKRNMVLCPNGISFSDVITLTFVNQRQLILEYPITVRERETGQSIVGTQTAIDVVFEILNLTLLFNPLRVFVPLAILSTLAGVLWGIPFVLMGRGVSVAAMLMIVLGALFFVIGLIASQLSAFRLSLIEIEREKESPPDA